MITRVLTNFLPFTALEMNSWSILVVMSKSAITPSLSGLTATMEPGVLPITSFASCPTYLTRSYFTSTATTLGSRIIMPFPRIYTRVFAVPRSIPISLVNISLRHTPFILIVCIEYYSTICLWLQLPKTKNFTEYYGFILVNLHTHRQNSL